jgi:hypothetical protein
LDAVAAVTAYLAALDLGHLDLNALPRKTDTFWSIVNASHAPKDAHLADVLDELGNRKS